MLVCIMYHWKGNVVMLTKLPSLVALEDDPQHKQTECTQAGVIKIRTILGQSQHYFNTHNKPIRFDLIMAWLLRHLATG